MLLFSLSSARMLNRWPPPLHTHPLRLVCGKYEQLSMHGANRSAKLLWIVHRCSWFCLNRKGTQWPFFLAEGKWLLAADSLFRENTDTQTWNPRSSHQRFRYILNSRCLLPWTSASWKIWVRSWKTLFFILSYKGGILILVSTRVYS